VIIIFIIIKVSRNGPHSLCVPRLISYSIYVGKFLTECPCICSCWQCRITCYDKLWGNTKQRFGATKAQYIPAFQCSRCR